MSDILVYLIQNFASHLLAAIITLFILKFLLKYDNAPYPARQEQSRNWIQGAGRRSSTRHDSVQRANSKRVLKDRGSVSIGRNCSMARIHLQKNGKQPYILNQKGFLQPVRKIEEHVYTTTLKENEDGDSDSDISQITPESVDVGDENNINSLNNYFEETPNITKYLTMQQQKDEAPPDMFRSSYPSSAAKDSVESSSKSSKVSKTLSPQDSKMSKNRSIAFTKPSSGTAARESSSLGLSFLKKSSSLSPKTSDIGVKKSAKESSTTSKEPSLYGSALSKEPSLYGSASSKEPSPKILSPQDSKVSEDRSNEFPEPLPLSTVVEESSSLVPKISEELTSQGSSGFRKSWTPSLQESAASAGSSPETLKVQSQGSKVSEETVLQNLKLIDESADKKPGDDEKQGDKVQSQQKCSKKIFVIDVSKLPPCLKRNKRSVSPVTRCGPKIPHYPSCESVRGDELVPCSRPKLCQSDCSECESEEYSQDSSDSCTNSNLSDTSFCLWSPERYPDYRERRCEPDPYKTLIIDFRPGYFLSCFSKCCKKLFSKSANKDCISNECRCNCSGCKFNSKRSKPQSNIEERQKQKNTNLIAKEDKENLNAKQPDQKVAPITENPPSVSDVQKEDSQKSQDKPEDDPRNSQEKQNKEFVVFCNVGVNTNKEEMNETFHKSSKDVFRHQNPEGTNDILCSSSELIGNSYFESRKLQNNKRSFNHLKKDVQTFRECTNTLPIFSPQKKTTKYYRPKEPSLIGWQQEQSLNEYEIINSPEEFDISEMNNEPSSRRGMSFKKNLNRKKMIIRSNTVSSNTSNESEVNEVSDTSYYCKFHKIDSEKRNRKYHGTDSEERSSFEEELAKDLVQSFRSILSEMTLSTFKETGFVYPSNSNKKYKIRLKPRKKEQDCLNTRSPSNQTSSNTKINLEEPFKHSMIDEIEINTSDYKDMYMGETDEEIKYSIEKNLEELASLLPSFSEPSPSEYSLNERCGCKQRPGTFTENSEERSFYSSYDGSYISKDHKEKRENTKTHSKETSKVSYKRPRKSKIKETKENRLLKLSKFSPPEALSDPSSNESIRSNEEKYYSSEEISSKDIKISQKLVKKCKKKHDMTVLNNELESKSIPTIAEQNKTSNSLTNGKPLKVRHSNFNSSHKFISDAKNNFEKNCDDSIPFEVEENNGFMRSVRSADQKMELQADSKSNEFIKSYSDSPHDISQGSIDANDLSSYTILDLGPYEKRFPKLSFIPSDMDSWVVLQRHKDRCKCTPETITQIVDVLDSGSRGYESRQGMTGMIPEHYSETQRNNEPNDDGNLSSDSDDCTEIINFGTFDNSQRALRVNNYSGRGEGSSNTG